MTKRSTVMWFTCALCWLSACAVDGVSNAPEVTENQEDLQGRFCAKDSNCPAPGAPCRKCDDGSFVCPEVDCIKHRCVYDFPSCPAPFDPCAGKSCGDTCRLCPPDQPGCIETDVVKFCQPDGSCSAPMPECAPAEKVSCGGFAAFPCPGSGSCVDDPSDDCDPRNGGADCPGMCICKPSVCPVGQHFDSSPSVCACVGAGPACGDKTCDAGQICCSPSCGICGPKNGLCPQIICGVTL
jgi:hypothetical protein